MTSSRSGQNEVSLRCRATTPMPGRDARGPLVADDHGMAVVAGRKWLHAGASQTDIISSPGRR